MPINNRVTALVLPVDEEAVVHGEELYEDVADGEDPHDPRERLRISIRRVYVEIDSLLACSQRGHRDQSLDALRSNADASDPHQGESDGDGPECGSSQGTGG